MNILFDATFVLHNVSTSAKHGILRVEKAWLQHLHNLNLEDGINVHYLIRRGKCAYILDASQGHYLLCAIDGTVKVESFLSRLAWKLGRRRRAVKLDINRRAFMSARIRGKTSRLSAILQSLFPTGGWYLSAAMSVESVDFMLKIKHAGLRTATMLHDTIPLDLPEFCHDKSPSTLLPNIIYNARYGDVLLCNSQVTANDFQRHALAIAGVAHAQPIVAHLASYDSPIQHNDAVALPQPLVPERPKFMILGTIEPRKNHSFLLDLWEIMAQKKAPETMPQLIIAGRWGWKIDALRTRVAASPELGRSIFVFEGPDDETVDALLFYSNALLMPSLAEGFGLPVIEAAQRGIPVLANDLPIYREIAGDYADLIPLSDREEWIGRLGEYGERKVRHTPLVTATWNEHCTTFLDKLRSFSSPHSFNGPAK